MIDETNSPRKHPPTQEKNHRGKEAPRTVGPGTTMSRTSRSSSSSSSYATPAAPTPGSKVMMPSPTETVSWALTTLADRDASPSSQANALQQVRKEKTEKKEKQSIHATVSDGHR